MNRFAIEEDDQFEIYFKDYTDEGLTWEIEIYNAVKQFMLKAYQGSGYRL